MKVIEPLLLLGILFNMFCLIIGLDCYVQYALLIFAYYQYQTAQLQNRRKLEEFAKEVLKAHQRNKEEEKKKHKK